VFTPITCNDNNTCTTDTCDPATGCVFTPIPPTGSCINPSFGLDIDECVILQLGGGKVDITGPSPGIDGDICVGPGGRLSESFSSPGTVHGKGRLSDSCSSFHGRPAKFTGGIECNQDLSA